MISRKIDDVDSFHGNEGSELRPLFYPENTKNEIRYSLAHSIILPGKRTKIHKMKSTEVYFVLEGKGVLHIDDELVVVDKHQSIFVPPFSLQYLENTGDVDFAYLFFGGNPHDPNAGIHEPPKTG